MKKSFVYILSAVMIIGAVSFGLLINAKYKQTLTNISTAPEVNEEEENNGEMIEEKQSQHSFTLLLFGISNRVNLKDSGRADTIMLALIDPLPGKIQLISIPRDTYVDIPGYGNNKINAAYPRGGADLLKKTIENWLDIDIHAYASINFEGFIDLVDLVGGIEVYVPRNMKYDDIADGTSIDLKKASKF
jgi:polyisoprenyl-teichoic acid--peptidoglycan teichoic acid transferase